MVKDGWLAEGNFGFKLFLKYLQLDRERALKRIGGGAVGDHGQGSHPYTC